MPPAPGLPCALVHMRAARSSKARAKCAAGPNTHVCVHTFGVIARLDRAIQYSETPVIESRGRSVLHSPPSRGMTSVTWRTQRRLTLRHCERSDLSAEAFGEGGSNPESFRGGILDCFVARAPRNDEEERASATLRSRALDAAQRPPAMRSIVRFNGALPSRRPSIRNRRVAWVPTPRRNARALQLVRDTSDAHRFAWGCRRLTSGMPACRPEWMFCAFRKI